MPIYEYKCPKCGVFEAMQRITEPSLKKCPTCKSKVERQISRGSFILKGSGWYATDYAKKANGTDSSESTAPATNGGASSSDSSAKTSGESKPASDSKPESRSSSDSKPKSAAKSSSDKPASAKAAD
jgi:putative FmdB family regulatory protein